MVPNRHSRLEEGGGLTGKLHELIEVLHGEYRVTEFPGGGGGVGGGGEGLGGAREGEEVERGEEEEVEEEEANLR
jgi:hypothetical protein